MVDRLPKPPPPLLAVSTHHSLTLQWTNALVRLKSISQGKADRIAVEVQYRRAAAKTAAENQEASWDLCFTGFHDTCVVTDLHADTGYETKMRFRMAERWSDYSESSTHRTAVPPQTGEDIHRAIRANNDYELEKILERGEANVEAPDNLGFTPLMAVAQKGSIRLAEVLLAHSAQVDTTTDADKTALMMAAFKGRVDMMSALIDAGAGIDLQDRNGNTALHYAVDGEKPEAIQCIADRGGNMDIKDREVGWTPLLRCTALRNNGKPEVVRRLLKCGAAANAVDGENRTALYLAAMNDHVAACDALLGYQAAATGETIDTEMRSTAGHTALTVAEAMERTRVIRTLTEHRNRLQKLRAQSAIN